MRRRGLRREPGLRTVEGPGGAGQGACGEQRKLKTTADPWGGRENKTHLNWPLFSGWPDSHFPPILYGSRKESKGSVRVDFVTFRTGSHWELTSSPLSHTPAFPSPRVLDSGSHGDSARCSTVTPEPDLDRMEKASLCRGQGPH